MSFADFTNKKKEKESFVGDVVKKSQNDMGKNKKKGGTSFMGRDFNYSSAIRTPNQLGMSKVETCVLLPQMLQD